MAKEKPESRSLASAGTGISQAPEPDSARVDNFDPVKVEVTREAVDAESLYWFGTLLMEGEFDMRWPASLQEIDAGAVPDESGNYSKIVRTTAWKLWYTQQDDIGRFWACRNGYYQQLDASGLSFPAFTERSEKGGTNEALTHKELWPGAVCRLSDSSLKEILESVQNHAIRPKGAPWSSHPGAEIVNYKSGHMPGCPGGLKLASHLCSICRELESKVAESNALGRRVTNSYPEFRHRGDLPMSDYVYLLRLNAPLDTPPSLYYRLVPSLPQFFTKQPPALSKDLGKTDEKAA